MRLTLPARLALTLALALAYASPASAQGNVASAVPRDMTVRFRDRRIDLTPFFEGFPYQTFRADYDAGRLMYFRNTRTARELWTLPLDASALELDRGTRLGTIDWNTRGLAGMEYHPPTRQFVVMADEANEEHYNLYTLSVDTGELQQLTHHPYVYGFGIDQQRRFVGYVPRYGATLPYRSCLNLIDLASHENREIVCDTPGLTLSWTDVNFRPDGAGVVINAMVASDRHRQNLVYVDLTGVPAIRPLTDPAPRRQHVGTAREWLDNQRVVYTSDESGFTNVYVFDLAANAARQVTHLTEDVDDVVVLRQGERRVIAAILKRPYESELLVLDPETGAVLARHTWDASVGYLDFDGNRALATATSRRTRFALDELTVTLPANDTSATFAVHERAAVPTNVAEQIERCRIERVTIPTFDVDSRTGHPRLLHAYLQLPRDPPRDPARRFAVIESFYGGENVFDTSAQIYCAMGGAVLSPAVRGSDGFGAAFSALNDHDLGGNEIVDLMYVGRYLAQRLGITERQIGVYGGSHGGYAAMRALTMPPEINGQRERFNWGFGVSYYGFSNILTFYEHSNIPDWVLLEAGDPRTERERLLDRSPLTHADLAAAPMLLLHGEHDNRVPVAESRQMAAALRRAHRPVTYVEFAGQGHGLKGLGNQRRVWTEVARFLERTLDGGARRAPAVRNGRARGRYAGLLAGVGVLAVVLVGGTLANRRR